MAPKRKTDEEQEGTSEHHEVHIRGDVDQTST